MKTILKNRTEGLHSQVSEHHIEQQKLEQCGICWRLSKQTSGVRVAYRRRLTHTWLPGLWEVHCHAVGGTGFAQDLMLMGWWLSWERSCCAHGKYRSEHRARFILVSEWLRSGVQGRMSTRGDKPAQAVSTLSARKCCGPRAIAVWLGGGWSTAGTRLPPPADPSPRFTQAQNTSLDHRSRCEW